MPSLDSALQRLDAAVGRLENAALTPPAAGDDAALREEVRRLSEEKQALEDEVAAEKEKNKVLGKRLDGVIAKLNALLEQG